MNDVLKDQRFKKRIYSRPWFWLVILGLIYGTWWAYGNYKTEQEFQASIAPYRQMYENAVAYDKLGKESIAKETAMLRADTYGGATPEETLAMFVKALEAKDAKLASKYYMPWLQDDAEKDMKDWIENYGDGLDKFLTTYSEGVIERDESYVIGLSVDVYEYNGDPYPYVIKMEKNEENNIWKITEF